MPSVNKPLAHVVVIKKEALKLLASAVANSHRVVKVTARPPLLNSKV